MKFRFERWIILALILFTPLVAKGQSLPKWEVGVGMVTMQLPYYRGSETDKNYLIPFPYLIYRGERFNLDEDGLRGWLFQSDRIKLDFSLAGGVPVPADQNGSRAGMPELKPTVEIGPSLEINFWRSQKKSHSLWLVLPLRSAFSVDLPSLPHEGWVFAPYLTLDLAHYNQDYWESSIAIGPMFADSEYHNYFYGVTDRYATATRPSYDGSGGYAGSRITFTLKREWGNKMVAAFARFDDLDNAVFEDSPLVKSGSYHIVGVAFTWILAKSTERVDVP